MISRRPSGATRGPLGYVSALGATRLVHWLILVAPSCLRSHNARYIMLKSLIQENAFEDVVFEMTAILSRGRWVKMKSQYLFLKQPLIQSPSNQLIEII